MINDVATVTFVVESNLSSEAAFAKIIDLSRVAEWDRGIHTSTLAAGEIGRIGARYEVTVTGFDGLHTTVEYELTEIERPQSFRIVGVHADFQADDSAVVEPTATGCRVTYNAGLVLLGENPPLDESQLQVVFEKNVEIARSGLDWFLATES